MYIRLDHTDRRDSIWIHQRYVSLPVERCVCLAALQRECVLCDVEVGFMERKHQTVCVDGSTEMVAKRVNVELLLPTYPDDAA